MFNSEVKGQENNQINSESNKKWDPRAIMKQATSEGVEYTMPSSTTVLAKLLTGANLTKESHEGPLLMTIDSPFKPLKSKTIFTANQCFIIAVIKGFDEKTLLVLADITNISCVDNSKNSFEYRRSEEEKGEIGWLRERNTNRGIFSVHGKKFAELNPGKSVIIQFENPIEDLIYRGNVFEGFNK